MSKRKTWAPTEIKWVKTEVKNGRHPKAFLPEFNTKFGQDRTMDSFTGMMTRNSIDYSHTEFTKVERKNAAKILILDIETAPLQSFTWGCWDQNIAPGQIISDWFMLTWSAKWLFEEEVFSDRLTSKEAVDQNDKRISQSIWDLVNEADIIIAHNGVKFDMKRLNTRWLINGIEPPMSYQVIDTLQVARRRFALSHNKLDYINKVLGLHQKIETGGFALWSGCMKGDVASLKKMEEYNIGDVEILEETYLKLRAWILPHPNVGVFIDGNIQACPSCGGTNIFFTGKKYATTTNVYESFRCDDCKSIGRERTAIKKENKVQLTSVPR